MSYQQLIKTRKNILSSLSISGSYDFWTTIVCFDSIDEHKIKKMQESYEKYKVEFTSSGNIPIDEFNEIIEVYTLARHEYTHYVDSTSTIWGLKYLLAMSAAYSCNTDIYKGTEENYHFARSFFDLLRFIRLPKYFTEKGPAKGNDLKWKYSETVGNRFTKEGMVSDHPILFMRFLDYSGRLIVRSPVSILSILECSAMSQEVLFKLSALQSRTHFPEYKVEFSHYEVELKNYLYNKEITEYSACAHLIASKLQIQSVFEVFELCSIMCRFILNTTSKIYELILKRDQISKVLKISDEHAFVIRFKKGLGYHEPGFLFYLLCRALQLDNSFEISTSALYKALLILGVSKNEYDDSFKSEMEMNKELAGIFPQDVLKKTAERGISNSELIDVESFNLPFESLDLPPAYLGDGLTCSVFKSKDFQSPINNLDLIYEELNRGQSWVERFVEAC